MTDNVKISREKRTDKCHSHWVYGNQHQHINTTATSIKSPQAKCQTIALRSSSKIYRVINNLGKKKSVA